MKTNLASFLKHIAADPELSDLLNPASKAIDYTALYAVSKALGYAIQFDDLKSGVEAFKRLTKHPIMEPEDTLI